MDNLKPCPFCGSEELYADNGFLKKYVFCRNCHAYGPSGETEEEAIRLWNHAPRIEEEPKMEKCCENCVHISKEVDGKVYCTEELDEDYSCKYWAQANPFELDPQLCWNCKYNYVDDECAMYCGREIGNPKGYVCDKWDGVDNAEAVKASVSTPLNPSNSSGLDVIGEIVTRTLFPSNVRQLIEEAAELIVACNKYIRATGNGQPTPVSEDEALAMIAEELADVHIVGEVLRNQSECLSGVYTKTYDGKADRWLKRLNGKDDEKTP